MAEQYTADRPMPYTPDEAQIREWLRDGTGEYADIMDEWLDRFLARVKRDAWDEGQRAGMGDGLTVGEIILGVKDGPPPGPTPNPYREQED